MKKIFLITCLLLQMSFAFGQKSTNWSEWKTSSCYRGLQYSVKRSSNEPDKQTNSYWWNIKFKNNYTRKVSFDCTLNIDGEIVISGRWDLNSGSEQTYTPVPCKSGNSNFNTTFSKVCFSNGSFDCAMGGKDKPCYAECDNGTPKIPKDCGSNNSSSNSNTENNSSSNSTNSNAEELINELNNLCTQLQNILNNPQTNANSNVYNSICSGKTYQQNEINLLKSHISSLKNEINRLEGSTNQFKKQEEERQRLEEERRLAEEERIQKEKEAKKAQFDNAIQNGDSALSNKQYDSAMSYYSQAKSYAQDSSEKSIAESKYNQAYEAKRIAAREERLEKQAKQDELEDKAYVGMAAGAIGFMAMINDQYVHKYFSGKFQIGMGYEQMPLITNQNNQYAPKASYSDKTSYPTFHFGLRLEFLNNKLINLNTRAYYSLGFNPFQTGISGAYSETGFDGGIQFWYKKNTKIKLFADVGLYKRTGTRTADLDAINNGTTATDDVREGEYNYSTLKFGGGPMFHHRHDGRETWIKPGIYFEKISFAKDVDPTMSFSISANIESEIIVEFSYSKNYVVAGKINYPDAFTTGNQNYFSLKLIRQGKLW